jgi:Rod binding domain-containing protein
MSVSPAGEHLSQIGTSKAMSPSAAAAPQPRLVKAAHEFEAALMKELMAPLAPGGDAMEGGAESGSNSALSSFASEALGKALSERGGFGIATRIIHQLTGNHSGNAPVPKQSRLSATHGSSQ